MEENNKKSFVKKRKKELIITIVSLLLIVGLSFAWLRRTINSNEKNVLLSGKLRLTIMNEDPIIKAGGEDGYAIPMADEYGLQTTPYTFTIKNTGTVEAAFQLSLTNATSYTEKVQATDAYGDAITNQYGYGVYNDVTRYVYYDSNRIPDSLIKFNIREGSNTNTTATVLGDTTGRVMFSGTIAAGATKTYYLRLWVSSEAEADDVEDKVFAANLKLEAMQSSGGASFNSSDDTGGRNPHIKGVYEYISSGSGSGSSYTGCIGGDEAGCVNIISSITSETTYTPGTIVKYEVKDGTEKYFNVLHDDGDTLTMQERENTVNSKAWYTSGYNVYGPNYSSSGYALYELEQLANTWTYVNTQNYSIGNSSTTLGYTGCSDYNSCSSTQYQLSRSSKVRMITIQEAAQLGCTQTAGSCSKFLYNYLSYSPGYGGTYEGSNQRYWTMSTDANYYSNVWYIDTRGYVYHSGANTTSYGARAVIVINKGNGATSVDYGYYGEYPISY